MAHRAKTQAGITRAQRRQELESNRRIKRCTYCDQPMKPKGITKRPNEYDHARGCPYDRSPR